MEMFFLIKFYILRLRASYEKMCLILSNQMKTVVDELFYLYV